MPTLLTTRPLTVDTEIHAVLGFRDSGLIDWGFDEGDLPPGRRHIQTMSLVPVAHSQHFLGYVA